MWQFLKVLCLSSNSTFCCWLCNAGGGIWRTTFLFSMHLSVRFCQWKRLTKLRGGWGHYFHYELPLCFFVLQDIIPVILYFSLLIHIHSNKWYSLSNTGSKWNVWHYPVFSPLDMSTNTEKLYGYSSSSHSSKYFSCSRKYFWYFYTCMCECDLLAKASLS